MELATPEEKEKQRRLGGVVADFTAARYSMRHGIGSADGGTITTSATEGRVLLKDFTYSFRQRDRIGIVGPNGWVTNAIS